MTIAEKLQTIAEKQQAVYDKGFFHGEMNGLDRGIEQGKEQYYQHFWDNIMARGARTNFVYGFAQWDSSIFYPSYDIRPTGTAASMFQTMRGEPIDLKSRMEECGKVLDFSQVTNSNWIFGYSYFTHLPRLDFSKSTTLNGAFYGMTYLETIDEVVIKEDGTCDLSNAFDYDTALKHLKITGTIGLNGLNLQWSTLLTRSSLCYILAALSNTTKELSITLPLAAVNREFETTQGANDGSSSPEWLYTVLEEWCPNWNIILA